MPKTKISRDPRDVNEALGSFLEKIKIQTVFEMTLGDFSFFFLFFFSFFRT